MKSTRSKTSAKTTDIAESTATKSRARTKSNTISKSDPTEEEIRELSEILYHQRIYNGEQGSAVEDWLRAEDYLRNSVVKESD